mgnify:CR=1 FL=1
MKMEEKVVGRGRGLEGLRIGLAYNARQPDDPPHGERLEEEYVARVEGAIGDLGHRVVRLEMTRPADRIVDLLLDRAPDLVFNLAEGTEPTRREAFYPAIYEVLRIPYTGGGPALLRTGLNKRLTKKILSVEGVQVPRGFILTGDSPELPEELEFPLFFKPNEEGSSIGITRKSVARNREEAEELAAEMVRDFPLGVDVEEFIEGKELTVPMLEEWPDNVLEIVEYNVKDDEGNIMGQEIKGAGDASEVLDTYCPARLTPVQRDRVLKTAETVYRVFRTDDFGRVDLRLDQVGQPYFIEINPLPGLREKSPLVTAAAAVGFRYEEVIERIITSAARRYGLIGSGLDHDGR